MVAVLDTGFDLLNEAFDDNVYDWELKKSVNEYIYLVKGERPLSHGTHVLDHLSRGLSHHDFLTYALTYNDPNEFPKIGEAMKASNVRFANMSLGFDSTSQRLDLSPGTAISRSLFNMVRRSPEILYFIAAGNSRDSVDRSPRKFIPAGMSFKNTLVVGALDTDKMEPEKFHTYKMWVDSNWGESYVDIFCAGANVKAAAYGGGSIEHSGTSLATPYCLREGALAIYDIHPELSNEQIKEIILKSAYIKDLNRPLPAVSGGMLYSQRAQAVAELMKTDSSLSVEQAILEVRRGGLVAGGETDKSGEPNSEAYLERLQKFWAERKSDTD